MGALRVAAIITGILMAVGCSSGDGGADGVERGRTVSAAELAEQAGCEAQDPAWLDSPWAPWGGEEALDCVVDATWPARIHAGLDPNGLAAARTLLRSRIGPPNEVSPCPDGSARDATVVTGDTWIVVIADGAGGRVVQDRLDGQIDPGDVVGPPISYPALPCGGEPPFEP